MAPPLDTKMRGSGGRLAMISKSRAAGRRFSMASTEERPADKPGGGGRGEVHQTAERLEERQDDRRVVLAAKVNFDAAASPTRNDGALAVTEQCIGAD